MTRFVLVLLSALAIVGCSAGRDQTDLQLDAGPDDLAPIPDLAHSPTWRVEVANRPGGIELNAVWGSGDNDVYAVGYRGMIVHRQISEGGAIWRTVANPARGVLRGIWGSGPSDLYVVGETGTILHSTNGKDWIKQATAVGVMLHGIWGPSATEIYAVGEQGTILHSTGNGTWQKLASPTSEELFSVGGFGPGAVFAGGNIGTILQRGPGDAWTQKTGTTYDSLTAITGTSATDVWAVGSSFTTQNSEGYNHWNGTSWSVEPLGTVIGMSGIAASSSGDLVAVGADYRSFDIPVWKVLRKLPGKPWIIEAKATAALEPQSTWLNSVWASGSEAFAVGSYGLILHRF